MVVVGAEESQANCWQKATPKVSLFSCFEKFRILQHSSGIALAVHLPCNDINVQVMIEVKLNS